MKAIVGVAASMLRSAFYMLTRRADYHDLGEAYFDGRTRVRTTNRLLKRLEDLGVEVLEMRVHELPAEPVSL